MSDVEVLRGLRAARLFDGERLYAGRPLVLVRAGRIVAVEGEAESESEIMAAIDERVARRVDVVKVMATGGVITPGWAPHESQYTAAELRTIVSSAHRHDLLVTAHAHGADGIAAALEAGVDGVEHATFLAQGGVVLNEQTLTALAVSRVFVGVASVRLPAEQPLPALFQAVAEVFARQYRAGVRLVCSSDAGINPQKPFTCLPCWSAMAPATRTFPWTTSSPSPTSSIRPAPTGNS